MLHEQKVIIAQHAIPEDTSEITQVRELLDPVDLSGAVVTGDAAHAQRTTAAYSSPWSVPARSSSPAKLVERPGEDAPSEAA
jgi:hypothetical protein